MRHGWLGAIRAPLFAGVLVHSLAGSARHQTRIWINQPIRPSDGGPGDELWGRVRVGPAETDLLTALGPAEVE